MIYHIPNSCWLHSQAQACCIGRDPTSADIPIIPDVSWDAYLPNLNFNAPLALQQISIHNYKIVQTPKFDGFDHIFFRMRQPDFLTG